LTKNIRAVDAHTLIDRALEIDGGVAAKPSLLGGNGGDTEPQWIVRADGAYVWDVRGRRHLDFLLGFGSVILGHADPSVTDAVVESIRRGVTPSLRVLGELELVDLLTRVVPNADAAMLMKTGSDATSAAVRLARAHSGRSVVLRSGYQGWHDWCAPRPAGIPVDCRSLTMVLPFGDADALRSSFATRGEAVAAVVVMPADGPGVGRDYLLECRRLADYYGSAFVLDEVRTGFRLALGGAQEYYGVNADLVLQGQMYGRASLTCDDASPESRRPGISPRSSPVVLVALSKAMGNGHPVSAVAGRHEFMRKTANVSMSSVFFRSADGIAAALATIRALLSTDALDVVWRRGRALRDGMVVAAARTGVPVRPVGLPPLPGHVFDLDGDELRRAEDIFYKTVWAQGLLLPRNHHWFTCAAMTTDDVRHAIDIIASGYQAVAAGL